MKISSTSIALILLVSMLALAGCKTKQAATKTSSPSAASAVVAETAPEVVVPKWNTCRISNAQATVQWGKNSYNVSCSVYTTRDSLIILSVTPLLGIEMFRIEATPTEMVGIDKLGRRCLVCTYDELNRYIAPALTYDDLQRLATHDIENADEYINGKGSENGKRQYNAMGQTIGLSVRYTEREQDVVVPTRRTDLSRYNHVTIEQFLQ